MRKETRHRLQPVQRKARVSCKFLERLPFQKSELLLNPRKAGDKRRFVA